MKKTKAKKIILKESYEGSGLFYSNGHEAKYEKLHLPEELIRKIESWQSWYWDSFFEPEDFDSRAHNAKGWEVAHELKKYFGEDVDIVYNSTIIRLEEENNDRNSFSEEEVLKQLSDSYLKLKEKYNISGVKEAEKFAKKYHAGQQYADFGDYFEEHLSPVRDVAVEIAQIINFEDTDTIEIVALLHDVIEDTTATKEDVLLSFGQTVADSVEALTRIKTEPEEEYFRLISQYPEAKIVKAADRIFNIKMFELLDDEKKLNKLKEKYIRQMEYFKKYDIYFNAVNGIMKEVSSNIK
jgi:hypothetical protein